MKTLLLGALLVLLPAGDSADAFSEVAGSYRVLPSSRIHFSVARIGGAPVEGEFKRFKGNFRMDGKDVSRSKVEFSLEPGSVSAVDPRVEEFIKSEPVFDVARYPVVSFVSTSVKRVGENKATIEGRLTAKGVNRTTRFAVSYEGQSAAGLKFHVTGKLSRALFNMDVGTPVYSNMVVLDMTLLGRK